MNNTHVIAYINIHMHRAVRYDDMYRIDEIKSLSFHIMFSFISWCRKIHCLR